MTEKKVSTESLFIVKGRNEYCFLYPRQAPGQVYRALLDAVDQGESDLDAAEVLEVIESLVVRGLRRL